MKKAIIIGSGFAGLSAACHLAKAGVDVTVIEKNSTPGGRARSFSAEGFTWDMGPSWYWMPDVFERFFEQFGKQPADFYELIRLNPSYQVFWEDESVDIPADRGKLNALFEHFEKGSSDRLDAFLKEAGEKYGAAMEQLVYKPGLSLTEFMRMDVLGAVFNMDLLQSIHKHVRRYFNHPKLLQLVEFPILFLGALPKNTPALYTLMNHADMVLGTWYPMGGMVQVVNSMYLLAKSLGVRFQFGEAVRDFVIEGKVVKGVNTDRAYYSADTVVAGCDYHHAESLLPVASRNYTSDYWATRSMAPSSLLYYIGVDRKLPGLRHHNLFFDAPFEQHAAELYSTPQWPSDPLMYVCVTSKTDDGVAPEGCENLFVLIPTAPRLVDDAAVKDRYFDLAIKRIESRLGYSIKDNIIYKRSYAGSDFITDYNAFKGNAYGLANTLKQTAIFKPSIRNKTLCNLFYTGQLTVPGPGVPPAIISGEIVARQVLKQLKSNKAVAV